MFFIDFMIKIKTDFKTIKIKTRKLKKQKRKNGPVRRNEEGGVLVEFG